MRRFLILSTSLFLLLGLALGGRLIAQDEKQDPAKPEAKPADAPSKADDLKPQDEAAKGEQTSAEPPPAAAPPALKPVPPEVEAKLEAARRAVAEAIVAAQDAGLVDTTIDPPPILDILILGQANDRAVLQAKLDELKANPDASPEAGLSVEVFGAWYSMQGRMEGVELSKNIRIVNPSKGLIEWYRKRAEILNRHIDEVRKAKATSEAAPTPDDQPAEAEEKKQEGKSAEEKPAEEKKADAPKEEEKQDESKPADEM